MLDAEPGVVLAYPRTLLLNEEGHVFGDYADDLHLMSSSASARYRELFDKQGLCHAIYGVMRSDVLAQTALMTNIARGDRILLADLVLYGKFWEVPDYLFYRRIHPQNSTTVLSTEADLTIWFDPDKSNKVLMPKWQRLLAYMDAVRRAPITPVEKMRCFGVLARYTLKLDRWRGMIDDALRASRQMRAKRLQRG
ncbi:MAG: hypothetical protein H3C34_17030 [Caldilineaceae bacterium]|nr:hypothetical protein [Caldilineaceae bacterium]